MAQQRRNLPVGRMVTVYGDPSYLNSRGGTSQIDLSEGPIRVKITRAWEDYETGWRYWGDAEGRTIYFSEHDLDQAYAERTRAFFKSFDFSKIKVEYIGG